MPNRNTIIWKIAVPCVCLALGAGIGSLLRGGRAPEEGKKHFYEKREGGYQFINPLLECDSDHDVLRNRELQPFRQKVDDYLRTRMRFPGVESASVYFRELNDGLWFSLGDTERFTPASLRKVPLMIAVLKQAERDRSVLGRTLPFRLKRDYNAQQTFKPSVVMTPGEEYTLGELIRRMIIYSDNNAFTLLSSVVDPKDLQRTYEALNMRSPAAVGRDDFLSVQTYASFFRVLFNATYLDKGLSELALGTLARAEFRSGIVAGVPPNVTVAHKFGEHRDDAAGKVQLHDCGIVYAPKHPYLLCVMTRGTNFEYLDDAIASISKIIYAEVDAQHRREHR